MLPGYHRRILIEPATGSVRAELEDDYHRMVVTLRHSDGVVTTVEPQMIRWPWTTCPGALDRLRETFCGQPLAGFGKRGNRPANCTHLHDLALFAAAHAHDAGPTAYDVHVGDPMGGRRHARLRASNGQALDWQLEGHVIIAPEILQGRSLPELGDWVAGLDRPAAEAARILRWATMVSSGRQMDIPPHGTAEDFPLGSCYTFSTGIVEEARRLPGAHVDLSAPGKAPMADRTHRFAYSPLG